MGAAFRGIALCSWASWAQALPDCAQGRSGARGVPKLDRGGHGSRGGAATATAATRPPAQLHALSDINSGSATWSMPQLARLIKQRGDRRVAAASRCLGRKCRWRRQRRPSTPWKTGGGWGQRRGAGRQERVPAQVAAAVLRHCSGENNGAGPTAATAATSSTGSGKMEVWPGGSAMRHLGCSQGGQLRLDNCGQAEASGKKCMASCQGEAGCARLQPREVDGALPPAFL